MSNPDLKSSTASSHGGPAPDVDERLLKFKCLIISGGSEICDHAKQGRFLTSLMPHRQWQVHKDDCFRILPWWGQPLRLDCLAYGNTRNMKVILS